MNSDAWRAISTGTVWVSTAIILTFGLYRMSGGSAEFFGCSTLIIIAGATAATVAIWKSASNDREPDREARGFEVLTPAAPVEQDRLSHK